MKLQFYVAKLWIAWESNPERLRKQDPDPQYSVSHVFHCSKRQIRIVGHKLKLFMNSFLLGKGIVEGGWKEIRRQSRGKFLKCPTEAKKSGHIFLGLSIKLTIERCSDTVPLQCSFHGFHFSFQFNNLRNLQIQEKDHWYQWCVSWMDIRCIFTPGSGIRNGKKSGSGIRDEHNGSYFRELRNNFLVKNT